MTSSVAYGSSEPGKFRCLGESDVGYTLWARMIAAKLKCDSGLARVGEDKLFLSSLSGATEYDSLKFWDIKYILTVGRGLLVSDTNIASAAARTHGYRCHRAVLLLGDGENDVLLDDALDSALNFIDQGLASGHAVLVHCEQGRSRSSAIIAAFLITRKGMDFASAMECIRAARPQAAPNINFALQLRRLSAKMNQIGE